MGQVENVSVETDPAFDRALKAAVQRGGSDPDAVLNALVEELGITGGTVNFTVSGLNNASVGRQSLDVFFLPGADPTAAANNAAAGWLPTLRSLSGNGGEYSSRVSLVEVNGGCIVAIEVTVEQPAEEDEPAPVTVTGIVVTQNPTKMTYISGESFNPAGMTVSEVYSDGTTKPVTSGYTWSPETLSKDTTEVTISYGGESTTVEVKILYGDNSYDAKTKTYSIATADGLMAWNEAAQKDQSINCTLSADINMAGKEWTWIGIWPGYSGVFNGQGHRITELSLSAGHTELFCTLTEDGVIKNLQLVDVNLYGNSGGAAGIVSQNNGQIIACSVTGKISAYATTCGIANSNYGSIIACWFDGTLKENECGAIVDYNYSTITSCYWGGNAGQGVYHNQGGTVDVTKVDGVIVKWQTAVDGMNLALTGNDYQWALGKDGLPVLQKKQ